MKATDRELLDISEELTAYIMKPTFNLCLSPDECIILNKLITEEFERRQEQDVMGSSNGQDTPLGQTGADNNDVALDASERRNNEASGTSLREKKKPQITKVSKKEYWDNRDKHGTYIETYFETCDMTDQPESHFGKEPYEEPEVPCLEQNYCKDCVHYSRLHHVDGMGECDHCSVTVWGDQLPCFGFERISSEDTNGNHNETTNEKTEEMPNLDEYIPIAWMEQQRGMSKIKDETLAQSAFKFVLDMWFGYGQKDWQERPEQEISVWKSKVNLEESPTFEEGSTDETTEGTPRTYCRDCVHYQGIRRVAGWGECARRQKTVLGDHFSCPFFEHFIEHS